MSDLVMGAWKYEHRTDDVRYGGQKSYEAAAAFLDGCGALVEDWGSGGNFAKRFFKKSRYIGLDGSPGRCDRIVDLRTHTSDADGILIRHVLEHVYDWPLIAMNAAKSFRSRLAIVFFIEPETYTRHVFAEANGIPNLAVGKAMLLQIFAGPQFMTGWQRIEDKETSPFGMEWMLTVERTPL